MITQEGARTPRTIRAISVGDNTYLDADIPCGLFEACNGHRYLIARDNDFKFAVALTNRNLPTFTWQRLGSQPLEYGRWRGPCRLRLTHALAMDSSKTLGTVGIGDGSATLLCRTGKHRKNWMPLGLVGRAGYEFCDYDGWILEAISSGQPFFERSAGVVDVTMAIDFG